MMRDLILLSALLLTAWGPAAEGAPEEHPSTSGEKSPAAKPPQVRVVTTQEQLLTAIKLYQQSEFDEARRLLVQLVRAVGDDHSRIAEETWTYLASVQVAFGEEEAAVQSFRRALAIRADLTLPAPSPRIAAALEQARRRFQAEMRAMDHDPPTQLHLPILHTKALTPVLITTTPQDPSGVKRVVLNYRSQGNRGYVAVTMEREKNGLFVATIPAQTVAAPGLEYYLEAWDVLGNGPGLKGSAVMPISIEVQGGPRFLAHARATPWYKEWWTWAVLSSVVITAGGVGTAIYLNREETARFDLRLNKDLNP
jgi:hypothetical protein